MLVFTRKIDEAIIIGDTITITINDIDGQSVRVGIEAPRTISVHREEVYLQIVSDGVGCDSGNAPNQHNEPETTAMAD